MSSATSQMLMFMPAWTRVLVEPEGDELLGVGMATEDDLVVAGWAGR